MSRRYPVYILIGLLILGLSLLALIVYPVSQLFYIVMQIPLVLFLWWHRELRFCGAWSMSILLALVYALAALNHGGAAVLAFLLLLFVMAVACTRLIQDCGWPFRPASGGKETEDAYPA